MSGAVRYLHMANAQNLDTPDSLDGSQKENSDTDLYISNSTLDADNINILKSLNEPDKTKDLSAKKAELSSLSQDAALINVSSLNRPNGSHLDNSALFIQDSLSSPLPGKEATSVPHLQLTLSPVSSDNIQPQSTQLVANTNVSNSVLESIQSHEPHETQTFPAPLDSSTHGEQSPVTSTGPNGERVGYRYFRVSNVDESTLNTRADNELSDDDPNHEVLESENRPLLDARSSSFSDSDQSTLNANLDTIGPLENPRFLKMLNYSASRISRLVQEDAFKEATSNLDLTDFTSTEPPPDMDGGWAWVVLFAAFFSLSLTGATVFAAGVMMSAILKIEPGTTITTASWIGAIHVSVLCMSGPFVGVVLNRVGARGTAFVAGLVLSAGLFAASYATSVVQLILSHGLVAGLGSGFILNTMFVTVGQYFNRYRGLACGLLATGSGAGMLAGGNAIALLLKHFHLRGTYMLWAGITLHTLIFAMLLRPSPTEQSRTADKKNDLAYRDHRDTRSLLNDSFASGRTNSLRGGQKQQSTRRSHKNLSAPAQLKSVLHRDASLSTSVNFHDQTGLELSSSSKLLQKSDQEMSSNAAGSIPALNPSSGDNQGNPIAEEPPLSAEPTAAGDGNSIEPPSPTSPSALQLQSSWAHGVNRSFRRRLISGSSQTPSQYTSTGRLGYRPSIREQLQRNDLDNESLASTLVSYLQPQDAIAPRFRLGSRSVSSMFGSISSFPTSLIIIKDDLSQLDTTDGPKKKKSLDGLDSFFDSFKILKNKPFLVFMVTCFLWALADSPFSLYLPAYTRSPSKGATEAQASSLYTGMGFGSMCGRFLSGLVASDSSVGPILLQMGCLSIASLVVGFSPWITSTFIQQMACAGLFGFYTGSLVPLSSLITIELLGIAELGLGFGFLSMAQGVGYLAGPPLLGLVIEKCGFEIGFHVAGAILLCASCLAMLTASLIRRDDMVEDLNDSLDELDKALQKISAAEAENSTNGTAKIHKSKTVAKDSSTKNRKEQKSVPSRSSSNKGGKIPKQEVLKQQLSVNDVNDLHIIREEV